jgi:hypothetical protein
VGELLFCVYQDERDKSYRVQAREGSGLVGGAQGPRRAAEGAVARSFVMRLRVALVTSSRG